MAAQVRKISEARSTRTRRPPAATPEARENQMISLAFDVAQRQLEDGTASAQVITHYLKLGTATANLERQKLEAETKLKLAQIAAMENAKQSEEIYQKALNAMRQYQGQEVEYED